MKAKPTLAVLAVTLVAGAAAGVWWAGMFEAAGDDVRDTQAGTIHAEVETVRVARGDIAAVVALNAVTVPAPSFVLEATTNGPVEIPPGLAEGDPEKGVDVAEGAMTFHIGGHDSVSPVAAPIEEWLVPDGGLVESGFPVVRLASSGFGLVGSMPPSDAYRLLDGDLEATGQIEGGPSGFDCQVLRAPPRAGTGNDFSPEALEGSGPEVVCAIPSDLRAYADVPGRIALQSGQVDDVLTLPVTAVSGSTEVGEVWVIEDDHTASIREVRLGATDGARVEIIDGLAEGSVVRAVPPPLVR